MRSAIQSILVGISVFILLTSSSLIKINASLDGYKHFTGTLDTNMRITFDIFSQNGTVQGYYYYGFPVPGESSYFQFGKTMAIEGIIEGNRFEIFEKINPESRFTGTIGNNGSMTGKWARRTYQKEVLFNLQENYNNGSIPLTPFDYNETQYVVQEGITSKDMPKANIDILLLYPNSSAHRMLKDTIHHYLSVYALDTNLISSSPEQLMKSMAHSFFKSYQMTTEGIPNIEGLAAFDWQKKISTEVLYNDNYILSLRLTKYAYAGGAHGVSIQNNLVFNLKNNSKVHLRDLLYEGFEPRLNALIDKKLRKLNGLNKSEKLKEAGFLIDEIEYNDNFFINNDGIIFYYNVYEIAPYASGPLEIFIPFYEIRGLLKDAGPIQWVDL
ncbi:MAG: DUF3298 and DUF4163 domain-containing protein [Bacteroidetes bacterium]|nr:DUF3298 and DUF4163 domain-containing protein [Bacteroidota bacterium]